LHGYKDFESNIPYELNFNESHTMEKISKSAKNSKENAKYTD
jgi:hypothetical protein